MKSFSHALLPLLTLLIICIAPSTQLEEKSISFHMQAIYESTGRNSQAINGYFYDQFRSRLFAEADGLSTFTSTAESANATAPPETRYVYLTTFSPTHARAWKVGNGWSSSMSARVTGTVLSVLCGEDDGGRRAELERAAVRSIDFQEMLRWCGGVRNPDFEEGGGWCSDVAYEGRSCDGS